MPCNKTLRLNNEPPIIGIEEVIGTAVLLAVFVSPDIGVVVALNTGDVPEVEAFGVTGTLNVLLPPAAIELGFVHVTEGVVVEHVQPLVVNVAGAVTPVGRVIVVVIGPAAEPPPILATVTGILLG